MESLGIPRYTEQALEAVDETIRELGDDIDDLEDFHDKAMKQPASNGGEQALIRGQSQESSVVNIYDEIFFEEESMKDRVKVFSEKYDLSLPAADLFDEFANVPDLSNDQALQLVRNLDRGNFNSVMKQQLGKMSEYPAKLREKIIEDAEIERDSLENYSHQIGEIHEKLYSLNEENPLPVGLDDAVDVIEELEGLDSRVKQLKDRRQHELRRREDLQQGYFDSQERGMYEDESFGRPVLQELDELDEALENAYENLTVDFQK